MRPPIARDWANVSTDLMVIEPTPVASASLLAQADLWIFSLLTSPYIGTAHLTGSSRDDPGYGQAYHPHQHMTVRVSPGSTAIRFSMTATRHGSTGLIDHLLWGSYDYTTTSQEAATSAYFNALVFQGFTFERIVASGDTVTTSPGAVLDRQILVEAKKVSSQAAIRTSHHTALSVWVGQLHQDMGAI